MDAAPNVFESAVLSVDHSKSESDLSYLQQAMLDATPDCIKLLSLDGMLLRMNRAGCEALGVSQASPFGMAWLPLLSEDARIPAGEALRTATAGHSTRFSGRSELAGKSTYWDNLLTPITDASGRVASILCVSRDVTAQTVLERELETAIEREKLLSREMQHRIKNMFSVAAGLIRFAESEAAQGNAPDSATRILRDKLQALARASDAAFLDIPLDDGVAGWADLETIVRSVLQPYGDRCVIDSPPTSIPARVTTMLALFLHELATNALKYGALCTDMGRVTIGWIAEDAGVTLVWSETGGAEIAARPDRQGFGSAMIDRIVQSIGGRVTRTWRPEGLIVTLHLYDNSA